MTITAHSPHNDIAATVALGYRLPGGIEYRRRIVLATCTLIAGDELTLRGYLVVKICLQSNDFDCQRQLKVIQILINGLVLVAGVAENGYDMLTPKAYDGLNERGG